jgi:hypothetical protein
MYSGTKELKARGFAFVMPDECVIVFEELRG